MNQNTDSTSRLKTGVEGAAWTAIQSLSDLAATKPPTNEADASSFIEAIASLRTQLPTEVQAFQSSLASAMSDFSSRFPRTTLPTSLLPTSIPSSSATGVVALSTSKTTTGNGSAVSTGGAEKMVGVVGYVAVAGGLGVVAAIL